MSQSQKKQNFLQGTALLAMATAIVKVIGALYKIPLNAIIGEQGFSYFNTAYEIYNVLLMISTAGLPVAMSRMISRASSLGHYRQVRKVYSSARGIFLGLGIAGSVLMTAFCKQLANFQEQPDAWFAIGCLGPCVLLICLMSTFRGFFQGQGNMLPTSVSQVLEAFVKLIIGIGAAVALKKATNSIPMAAGGAILGVTASCFVSAIYLFGRFRKAFRELPVTQEDVSTFSDTAKGLLAIAIPITIGSAGLQILTMLETKLYMSRLREGLESSMSMSALISLLTSYGYKGDLANVGYDEAIQFVLDTRKGIYNMTQTIFNMPCAFITPVTISIIPAITAQITTCDEIGAKSTAESAARITGLVCMPCAFGLAVLSEPVTALLGGYRGEKLALASLLMAILAIAIIFDAIVLVTTAIMQAHGHVNRPVINMFIGGILKLCAVYILTGNQNIGIAGAPIGTLLCYIAISALNIHSIRTLVPDPPAIIKNLSRSFLSAAIMGIITRLCWFAMKKIGIASSLLLCAVPIVVGVVVYVVAAVKLGAVTKEDCLLLPKGEKIAKLLKL